MSLMEVCCVCVCVLTFGFYFHLTLLNSWRYKVLFKSNVGLVVSASNIHVMFQCVSVVSFLLSPNASKT